MSNYITPNTINILGGGQERTSQIEYQTPPTPKPSRWEKFKAKAKCVWSAVMEVAEGIKDNIMPIIAGVGTFLVNWATFCRWNHSCDQQRRCAG